MIALFKSFAGRGTMVAQFLQNFLWLPVRLIFWFFFGYRIAGRKNYKSLRKPFLIISNHDGRLDPFFINTAFPIFSKFYPIRQAAKKELFEKKLSKIFISALGGFKVERGIGLEKSLKYALELLRGDKVVLIFPTGAREKPRGRPRKARRGAAYLALKTGVPILPVAIRNAKGLKFKDFIKRKLKRRKITILIGKPFCLPQELKYPGDLNKATEIIDRTLAKLRRVKVGKINDWLDLFFDDWFNNGQLSKEHPHNGWF